MSKIFTNKQGTLSLELADDHLAAWLTIHRSGKLIDEHDILDLIDSAGISHGFDEALRHIRKHGIEKEYGKPFPIAMCNYVKGETRLNLHFDAEQAKRTSVNIDASRLSELTCIQAGSVLADYSDNIFSRGGSIYNLLGDMIVDEAPDADMAMELAGEHVEYDAGQGRFVALCSGYPCMDDAGRISLIDTVQVDGDVENQELRTPVNLRISGSVRFSKIIAHGNVDIEGDLRDSAVLCEGDLAVTGRILFCSEPGLEVSGNVNCCSVVQSRVLCMGALNFASEIENSEVVAETGVRGRTADSKIQGGNIQCCGNIEVGSITSFEGSETNLEITISPYYKARLMRFTKEVIRARQIEDGEAVQNISEEIKRCEGELDRHLNEFLQKPRSERISIKVSGEVQPPLKIRVLKHDYNIRDRQNGLEIIEKD